jgi:dipeptidyl aminopeptidase/acylaminoacyl peptidase
MKYSEGYNGAKKYREDYFNSITSVLNERRIIADKNRKAHFDKMKNNQEEYRRELANMLGWPLGEETGVIDVNSVLLTDEDGVEVYRMQFKLKIGIVFSGLLYKHKSNKKLPFVICQHGGGGTAELCGGLLEIGTQNYNNMVERTVKKGANVFAPQLFLWNGNIFEPIVEGQDWRETRQQIDSSLKQVGSSITAVEIYAIKSVIDYFENKDFVDRDKIGMLGLSYGGFYTMHTTALETRIKVGFSCSQYNDRYLRTFADWVWFNSASKFFDNEVASLIYPRKFLIAVGTNDPVFPVKSVEKEFKKLKEMIDGNWVELEIFEGDHEFTKDDNMLNKFFTALLK